MGEEFVKRIRNLCVKRRMNIKQLEIALHFGNGAIGKMAHQKTSTERVQAIADYFGIGIEELLPEMCEETKKPAPDKGELVDAEPESILSDDEEEMLRYFRQLSDRNRLKAIGFLQGLSSSN